MLRIELFLFLKKIFLNSLPNFAPLFISRLRIDRGYIIATLSARAVSTTADNAARGTEERPRERAHRRHGPA